jgi:hypothetical protein
MPKRKANNLSQASFVHSNKKAMQENFKSTTKPNLLDDGDSGSSSSSSEDGSVEGGAKLDEPEFKINEEYAKRFVHNKKREELQRCQLVTFSNHPLVDLSFSGREIRKVYEAFEGPIRRQIRRGFRRIF